MEWISINEKLPDPFKLVLVYLVDAPFDSWKYNITYLQQNNKWRLNGLDGCPYTVTHWCPIPEINA